MNKIRTELQGGFPLVLDDLRFIDNTLRNGLSQIIKGVTDNCILWGCDYSESGTIASVTEGYVYFNDEIFYCPAHSVDLGVNIQDDIVLQVKEYYSNNAAANRVFADGTTHNVWAIREVELNNFSNHSAEFICFKTRGICPNDVPLYLTEIRKKSQYSVIAEKLKVENWQIPNFINGWTGDLKYRKIGNFIELRGELNGYSATDYIAFVLPISFRPNQSIARTTVGSGSGSIGYWQIFSTGEIMMSQLNQHFDFDEFFTND